MDKIREILDKLCVSFPKTQQYLKDVDNAHNQIIQAVREMVPEKDTGRMFDGEGQYEEGWNSCCQAILSKLEGKT